jgi:PAS domain-containing protein
MIDAIEEYARLPATMGEPGTWSPSLKTIVRMLLASPQPSILWWGGGELIQFDNAAYRARFGSYQIPLTWERGQGEGRSTVAAAIAAVRSSGKGMQVRDELWMLDRQWRYTYVNDRLLGIFNKSRAEVLGKKAWEVLPHRVGIEFFELLVHIVSHDLKAPLRAVANLSAWIEEDFQGTMSATTAQADGNHDRWIATICSHRSQASG